jgi:hypothetical protein
MGGQRRSFSRANTAQSSPSFPESIAKALPCSRETLLKKAAACESPLCRNAHHLGSNRRALPEYSRYSRPDAHGHASAKTLYPVGTRSWADGSRALMISARHRSGWIGAAGNRCPRLKINRLQGFEDAAKAGDGALQPPPRVQLWAAISEALPPVRYPAAGADRRSAAVQTPGACPIPSRG